MKIRSPALLLNRKPRRPPPRSHRRPARRPAEAGGAGAPPSPPAAPDPRPARPPPAGAPPPPAAPRTAGAPPHARGRGRQMLVGSLAAVGGVAAASALAGCAPPAAASGVRELDYWHLLSGGDGITMAGLVDKVNALDHGYEATQTVLAWGAPYYTKLAMA